MTALYVPGVEETDTKKIIRSAQLVASQTSTNTTGIATNTAAIAANTAAIAAIVVPSAAVQSDQETATSTTTFVAPGRQQFHPSAAKAYGFVAVSGTSITSTTGYNLASVTRTGTGLYTATFTVAFSSTSYACFVAGASNDDDNVAFAGAQSTGSVNIRVRRTGTLFDASFSLVCFGDQ